MNVSDFIEKVDEIMLHDYGMTASELYDGEEDFKKVMSPGESPEEFVQWLAEKHDLIKL